MLTVISDSQSDEKYGGAEEGLEREGGKNEG